MLMRLAKLIKPIAWRIPGGMVAGRWLHHLIDPQLREIERVRRARASGALQPFPTTSENRYPALFDALAERLAHLEQPRILSFGCATGEEVRALRSRLPNARITGLDASKRAIRIARKRDRHPLSDYRVGTMPGAGDSYEAILALAVCRHGDLERLRPPVCTDILAFSEIARALQALDRVLAESGWLAIWNAQFRFRDLPFAERYDIDPFRFGDGPPQRLLYGPDDRLMVGVTEDAVIFRKRATSPE